MKKILLLLISILSLTGCSLDGQKSYEQMALEYLNTTYSSENDAFTYINCGYGWMFSECDKYYFQSEKYNDNVTVYISEVDDEYQFEDNYFQLYMKEDAKSYFNAIANRYIVTDTKVRFNSPQLSNASKTFEGYVDSENCNMDVYFFSNETFTEDKINSILNEIADKKIYGIFQFVVTSEENLLSDYTLDYIINHKADTFMSMEKYRINKNLEIIRE